MLSRREIFQLTYFALFVCGQRGVQSHGNGSNPIQALHCEMAVDLPQGRKQWPRRRAYPLPTLSGSKQYAIGENIRSASRRKC